MGQILSEVTSEWAQRLVWAALARRGAASCGVGITVWSRSTAADALSELVVRLKLRADRLRVARAHVAQSAAQPSPLDELTRRERGLREADEEGPCSYCAACGCNTFIGHHRCCSLVRWCAEARSHRYVQQAGTSWSWCIDCLTYK